MIKSLRGQWRALPTARGSEMLSLGCVFSGVQYRDTQRTDCLWHNGTAAHLVFHLT